MSSIIKFVYNMRHELPEDLRLLRKLENIRKILDSV